MYEFVIIMLVGAACDMQGFYQSEMPGTIVACSNFDNLPDTMDHWNGFALATGYKIVYVVDSVKELPTAYHPEHGYQLSLHGIAYPTLNYAVAWRYVENIDHELAHLLCVGCGHGPMWELTLQWLQA